MKRNSRIAAGLVAAVALVGCAEHPAGPTVAVMPGPGKSFQAFQEDQVICKNYADQQTAGQADSANNSQLGTAILGTVLGAGLGAAIDGGRGAAIGAGAGALGGTAVGGGNAQRSSGTIQQRYNIAYEQCMASKGNQLPQPGYVTYYQPYYAPPPGAAVVVPPGAPAPMPVPSPATVTPAPGTVTPQ
ncbi:MAG TPA: glycine zipper family protein [Alphaproteobacteria bacterium]|nr:glycine zipper family protein [Alphaproteobacteria bacterium]